MSSTLGERVATLEEGLKGIKEGVEDIKGGMLRHSVEDREQHSLIMEKLESLDGWRWKVIGASGAVMAIVSIVGSAVATKIIH